MIPPITKILRRGKVRYRINLGVRINGSGKYQRKFFRSYREARRYLHATLRDSSKVNREFLDLTEVKRVSLMALNRLLESKDISLASAHDILSRMEQTTPGVEQLVPAGLKVEDAVQEFLEDCRIRALDPDTIREYKSHLGRLAKQFPGRGLAGIEKKELKKWINAMPVEPRTRRNYAVNLTKFWTYFVEEELVEKNPAALLSRPQSKRKRPEILSLEQITLFLQTVCTEEPNLLAPIAFSLFCGIRTKEVFKFHWSDIDLITATITIFEYVGKGDRPRKFKISDQLRAWLEFCPNKSGKVNKYPTLDNYWDVRQRIYRQAGIEKMPRNALRKSFSSYDWSLDQDTKRLCAVLGNSPNVAMRFYVDTEVDPEEGKKFKQLLPKQENPNTGVNNLPAE